MKQFEKDKQIIDLELNLCKTNLSNEQLKLLCASLGKNKVIQRLYLNLNSNKITDYGCDHILNLITMNESIKQLELELFAFNRINYKIKKKIHDSIRDNHNIVLGIVQKQIIKTNIKVQIAKFGFQDTKNFISFLKDNQHNYTHLFNVECDFQRCQLCVNYMKQIEHLFPKSKIIKKISFDMRNSKITNLGFSGLITGILQNRGLHSLTLDLANNVNFNDQTVDILIQKINYDMYKNLRYLNLNIMEGNNISNEKHQQINNFLKRKSQLKVIIIDGQTIKNAVIIKDIKFEQSEMQELINLVTSADDEASKQFNVHANLQCANIKDEQLQDLVSKLITNTTIFKIQLLLYGYQLNKIIQFLVNKLTDNSCLHLKNLLIHNKVITSIKLGLTANKISNEGVKYLCEGIKKNKTLKQFDIIIEAGNQISKESLQKLRNALKEQNNIKIASMDFNQIKGIK